MRISFDPLWKTRPEAEENRLYSFGRTIEEHTCEARKERVRELGGSGTDEYEL